MVFGSIPLNSSYLESSIMKKTLLLSFFFLLQAACKKEVKRNVVHPEKRDSQVVSSGEAVVILDTTDLYCLPKDTGGKHRKVYKNDSKSTITISVDCL